MAAPAQRRVCWCLAQCLAGSGAGSTWTEKENGTSSCQLHPNVPLCLTLEQLLVPARSPVQAIYNPGTSLFTRSSVLLCASSASLSHSLSQALAAPSVGKVHLNPIPTWNREGKGVWCWDRQATWNHLGQACFGLLGAWETCGQGYINVCLGEPLKVLQRSINTGPAARQQQEKEAVGGKTEPSQFLTVPAVQVIKELQEIHYKVRTGSIDQHQTICLQLYGVCEQCGNRISQWMQKFQCLRSVHGGEIWILHKPANIWTCFHIGSSEKLLPLPSIWAWDWSLPSKEWTFSIWRFSGDYRFRTYWMCGRSHFGGGSVLLP